MDVNVAPQQDLWLRAPLAHSRLLETLQLQGLQVLQVFFLVDMRCIQHSMWEYITRPLIANCWCTIRGKLGHAGSVSRTQWKPNENVEY